MKKWPASKPRTFCLCTLLLAALLFMREEVSAQTLGAIKGKVTDTKGVTLVGVTVKLEGNVPQSQATDANGNYSFTNLRAGNYTLTFSLLGFSTSTNRVALTAGQQSVINVSLDVENTSLDEIVVVGYGTQKKSDLTGAVTSVTSKELEGKAVSNINQGLQGQVAGAEITSTSGEPGAALQIRIRGQGTFSSAGPLYVVDGVPIPTDNVNSINPDDIDAISILKDASASAIYGSRAANGVVLISTKKGNPGESKLSFNSYYGVQQVTKYIPMANSQQLADVVNEADKNGGYLPQAAFNDPVNLQTNTDWQRAAFQAAPMQNYSLTVSGGGENAKFYVSGGYLDQEGVMVFSHLKRYSARVNSQFTIGKAKKLQLGESITINRSGGLNLGQGSNLDFTYLLGASPTMKLYKPSNLGGYGGPNTAETGVNNRENIVGRRDLRRTYTNSNRMLGNVFAEYTIIPGLKYRLNAGLNYGLNKSRSYIGIFQMDNRSSNTQSLNQSIGESNEYLLENTITYDKVFKTKYAINLLAGYTQQNAISTNMSGSKRDFPSNDLQVFDAGTGTFTLGGNESESALRSYLGRANITISDKYLFTATFRRDGSSRFGPDNRYGNFPSFALGWNVDRENFMKDFQVLSGLKLRASWGRLGNQEFGNYNTQTTVSTTPRYFFGADVIAPAAGVQTLGNPSLEWEATTQSNVGVDLAFLKNAFTFSADYWIKNTSGILLRTPISVGVGVGRNGGPYQNAAGIRNSGFEFLAGYRKSVRDLNFAVTANLSTVKNKVTSLGQGQTEIINRAEDAYQFGTFTYTAVGLPMSSYYGYIMDGIFQTQAEIDAHAKQPGAAPGDVIFRDINGDGIVDASDRTILGNPFPKFNYGLSSNLSYKSLDVSLNFQGVEGHTVYNAQHAFLTSMQGEHGQMEEVVNRWKGPGTSNTMPRAIRGAQNDNTRSSTRFIENADYLRLQSVQIGYLIPNNLVGKYGIKRLRAYVNCQNAFTITKYINYSPDIIGTNSGSGGNYNLDPLTMGVDSGAYPIPRVIQLGVQVDF